MAKPSTYPDWINDDDASKIETPSASKQLEGWLSAEKPPFQYFNWFWNLVSKWLQYFSRVTIEHNILIDTALHEGDYTTLAAYLADSPATGDRVYIGLDETVTAKLTIPAGIKLKLMKGKKLSCASNLTTIIEFGDNCETEGDFVIECSHTGTTAEAVSINGDNNHHSNIVVKNTSTGTITTAFIIESGQAGNILQGEVINSGGGSITTPLNDNSGLLSNKSHIRDTDNDIIHRGVDLPVISGGTGASSAAGALTNLGLTASASEINTACNGITATAAEINTVADGSTAKNSHTHLLAGGATDVTATAAEVNEVCDDGKYAGRGLIIGMSGYTEDVLQALELIVDGNADTTVDMETQSIYNESNFNQETLSKGGTGTNFNLNAGGDQITIKIGDGVWILNCSIVKNETGAAIYARAWVTSDNLVIGFTDTSGSALDLSGLGAGEGIIVAVTYIGANS